MLLKASFEINSIKKPRAMNTVMIIHAVKKKIVSGAAGSRAGCFVSDFGILNGDGDKVLLKFPR